MGCSSSDQVRPVEAKAEAVAKLTPKQAAINLVFSSDPDAEQPVHRAFTKRELASKKIKLVRRASMPEKNVNVLIEDMNS